MNSVGYFANPETPHRRSLVHAVDDRGPICGTRSTGQFQWCAHGTGSHRYVECQRCRKQVAR